MNLSFGNMSVPATLVLDTYNDWLYVMGSDCDNSCPSKPYNRL